MAMLQTMRRRAPLVLAVLAAALALCAAAPGPARAQTTTAGGEDGEIAATAPVRLEGRRLFDVTASGGATAADRAARIRRRLEQLVEREEAVPPFTPDDLLTRNGEQVIMLGDVRVMTVTRADAEDALADPRELALARGEQVSRAVAEARAGRANALTGTGILIRNSFQDLVTSFIRWLPRLAGALLLVVIFWLLARTGNWLMRLATRRLYLDPNLRDLLRALTVYGIWAGGLFAILSTLGVDGNGIAAAVGVSGLVLGFAFQGILSHFLAGLLLLLGGRFRVGDQIVLREFEGTVERIELRALHLRTYDNRLVVIPNADVFSSVVTSNTASPHRRRAFTVGIGYNDDIARAQRIAVEAVRATPGVLEEPAPDVVVEDLAASTVHLQVRFGVNSLRADYVRVGSACMKAVKEAFEREGVSMPSDIRTIVIKDLDDRLARLEKVLTTAAQANSNNEANPAKRAAARADESSTAPPRPFTHDGGTA